MQPVGRLIQRSSPPPSSRPRIGSRVPARSPRESASPPSRSELCIPRWPRWLTHRREGNAKPPALPEAEDPSRGPRQQAASQDWDCHLDLNENSPIPPQSPVSPWSALSQWTTWFLRTLKGWPLSCPPTRPPGMRLAPWPLRLLCSGVLLAGGGGGKLVGQPPRRVARMGPSLSIPMWTPTSTVEHLASHPVAASQWEHEAPARRAPAADPPDSQDEYGLGESPWRPVGRSAAPQVGIAESEWWAVSSTYTRARVALRWKWVVRRPCEPPPPHRMRLAAVEWPHRQVSHLLKGVAPRPASLEGRRRRKARWRTPTWLL